MRTACRQRRRSPGCGGDAGSGVEVAAEDHGDFAGDGEDGGEGERRVGDAAVEVVVARGGEEPRRRSLRSEATAERCGWEMSTRRSC